MLILIITVPRAATELKDIGIFEATILRSLGDPDNGIAPGTPFEDLPEDFECPVCGLGKDAFEKEED